MTRFLKGVKRLPGMIRVRVFGNLLREANRLVDRWGYSGVCSPRLLTS